MRAGYWRQKTPRIGMYLSMRLMSPASDGMFFSRVKKRLSEEGDSCRIKGHNILSREPRKA
jgi:hypothetical protein